ncbi:MAG: O-methyltransferase, partial [Candidatus Bathyarchaeota archaeon]
EDTLRKIEQSAGRRYLPIIGREKGRLLGEIVAEHKPRRVLEVGTLVGYSTIQMGKMLGGDAEIVTIEVDRDEAEAARENIRASGIRPMVTVVTGDALDIIPTLEGTFDLVFLDAAKHQYLSYLRLVEERLVAGAVVVADNAGFSSRAMRDYLEYVRGSGRYSSQCIPVGWDGIEISVKQ